MHVSANFYILDRTQGFGAGAIHCKEDVVHVMARQCGGDSTLWSPHPASKLVLPVEVVLFFTLPVQAFLGLPCVNSKSITRSPCVCVWRWRRVAAAAAAATCAALAARVLGGPGRRRPGGGPHPGAHHAAPEHRLRAAGRRRTAGEHR